MPLISAISIGSLSPNAEAIWSAQSGSTAKKVLIIREDDFFTAGTPETYFGQSWRSINQIAGVFDGNDLPSPFSVALQSYVVDKLRADPSIDHVALDLPYLIGLILEDNFADETDPDPQNHINIAGLITSQFIYSVKSWILINFPSRNVKISIIGLPCLSKWITNDNGATYQGISSLNEATIISQVQSKFITASAGIKWQAVKDLFDTLDFIVIDGRDYSSWNNTASSVEHDNLVSYLRIISRSIPLPGSVFRETKDVLCLVGEHEFIPPFRRALIPALSKVWKVKSTVGVLPHFKDPPTVENRSFVFFDFSRTLSVPQFVSYRGASRQTRAGHFGINDPAKFANWNEFIINKIKPWYDWGQRRFWLHLPFGSPNAIAGLPESGMKQMDSWIAARYGQNINGVLVNEPMPWLTEDFVGSWHYMTTGQPLSSSTEIYEKNRHTSLNTVPFSTFDPASPVEVVAYVGSPISHISSAYPDAIERINSMDPDRFQIFINDCYEPYLWSGMSLAFDKGVFSPQSWPGRSVSTSALSGAQSCSCLGTQNSPKCFLKDSLQAVWYRWLADLARRHPKRIYIQGMPKKMPVIDGNNPNDPIRYLDNDLKNFSFVCDDYEFISNTNNWQSAPNGDVYPRYDFVAKKQEVVRYNFNNFIPVESTGASPAQLEFYSLLADSTPGIEQPGGIQASGSSNIRFYKNNNNGDGTDLDPWKIYYFRHVVMKSRAQDGQTIQPLYSSLIDENKLSVINAIITASGHSANISGFSNWLKSNAVMGANPPSNATNSLIFNPKILSFYPNQGGLLSNHEQVVDQVMPTIAGCVDGCLLDSLSSRRTGSAFSGDIISDNLEYAMQFSSRRLIKSTYSNINIPEWVVSWSGVESDDDREQVYEVNDTNALIMLSAMSSPLYQNCACIGAGIDVPPPSSSSSSSFSSSSSSSSSSIVSGPANYDYTMNLFRFIDAEIYGYAIQRNNDPTSIDDRYPLFPYCIGGLENCGDFLQNFALMENVSVWGQNYAGKIFMGGALGKRPDREGQKYAENMGPLSSEGAFALAVSAGSYAVTSLYDIGDTARRSFIPGISEPTIVNKYQWFDFNTNEVKGSNRYSLASGYGGATFITKDFRKLDTPRTAYAMEPGSSSLIYDVIISNPNVWSLERRNQDLIDYSGVFNISFGFGNCSSGGCVNESVSEIESVDSGEGMTLAIRKNGSIAYYGPSSPLLPVPAGNNFIKAVVGGESPNYFALALRSDGSVVAWGSSPTGTNVVAGAAVAIGAGTTVKDIAVGRRHAVALTSTGQVKCWGDNTLGQCQVPSGIGVVSSVYAAQYYTIALRENGNLSAWGNGTFGNPNYLGIENIPSELALHTGFKITKVSAGETFAMALGDNGRVYCWGSNSFGQCDVPVNFQNYFFDISAGANHALGFVNFDSFVVAWGSNVNGQCSIPDSVLQYPSQTPYRISAGYSHSIILTNGGKKAPVRGLFSNDLDGDGIEDVPFENQIRLVSIDQTLESVCATLDEKGTVRILATTSQAAQGVDAFGSVYSLLLYYDENWIGDGFLTDDTGEPVFIENKDFVSVCATSGLNGMQEYVWCLHKSGKLYGVEMLSARSKKKNTYLPYVTYASKRKKFNVAGNPSSGRSPNFGKALDFLDTNGVETVISGTAFGNTDNYGKIFATNGTPNNNGYCKDIAHALNFIPKINGIRFPVTSVLGGYHTGGIVVCIDPTYSGYTPKPSDNFNHPVQMCEIVKLQDLVTGSVTLNKTLHRIKRYEAIYDSSNNSWTYRKNNVSANSFDKELYDSVFGVTIRSEGVDHIAYVPPRCVGYGRNLGSGGTTSGSQGGMVSIMGNNGNFALLTEDACFVPSYFSPTANPNYVNELSENKLNMVGDFTLSSSQFNYSLHGISPLFNSYRCEYNENLDLLYKYGQNPPGIDPASMANPPFDSAINFPTAWSQVACRCGWGNPPLDPNGSLYQSTYGIPLDGSANNVYGFSYYDHFGNPANELPQWMLREQNYINNSHIVKVIAYPDVSGNMPIFPDGSINSFYKFKGPHMWSVLSICDYEKLTNPFVWIRAASDSIVGIREDGTIEIIGKRRDDRDSFVFDPFWGPVWPEGRMNPDGVDYSTLRPADYQQKIESTRKVGQYFPNQSLNAIDRVPVQGSPEVDWYQSSNFALQYQYEAFNFSQWYDRYMFKIPGTGNDCSVCLIKNSNCSQTHDEGDAFFRRHQNNAWLPSGVTCLDGNSTTLAEARADFIQYVNIDGMVRSMSQFNPDWALVFLHGGAEPLWWPTQIPGMSQYALLADDGTGPNAIGLAYDIVQAYVQASHKYKTRLMAYFFPMAWVELDATSYPFAKDVRNNNIQEGRHGNIIDYRSIFKGSSLNYEFINLLADIHIELAQLSMNRETGYGFHGVVWDAHPVIYLFDFSAGAKAASGIDTSVNFPWPAQAGTALYNWLNTIAANGNVGSVLLQSPNDSVGFTQAVKDKLEQYVFAIRKKEAEFIREIRSRVDAAGYPDFIILPEVNATHTYEYPMICDEGALYSNGQKTEIGVENFKYRRQPANISSATGEGSMPDFWMGAHLEMLLRQGRAGKRSYVWQIGQWMRPASTGGDCSSVYNSKIIAIDAKYGSPSALGFWDGGSGNSYTIGVIPRDIAVRGWLENQSLLALASNNSIEFMYGFYSWYQWSMPELLDNDENIGSSFAVQHMPYMRRIASTLRSIKDSNVILTNRGQALWCVILHRPQISYKGGTYGPGISTPYYSYYWQIIGAVHTCVEHGVPKSCVQDVAFKADLFSSAAVVIVPFDPSYLPIEVKTELDAFDGIVIYMTQEYGGSSPRLENQFHNTTVDLTTGKTRAQIARDKLWNLMNTGPKNLIVQTVVEKPASLPEKPAPLVGYEYGNDSYGNQSIIATIMADASWHDLRKHTFYWDWNNGPLYSLNGTGCARQNLLYSSPVLLDGNDAFALVQSMGLRRILDNRWNDSALNTTCPNGFDYDCYFVEYGANGTIPIQHMPAQGKLVYYAGYPPVMGNNRGATISFNARQDPYRARQLLLETDNGRFNPIDMYFNGKSMSLIPFEQGSIVQVQLKEPSGGFDDIGICIDDNSLTLANGHELATLLSALYNSSSSASTIPVQLKCGTQSITREYNRRLIFEALINELVGVHLDEYAWLSDYPGSIIACSGMFPIGFVRAKSTSCSGNSFSLGCILFQNEGVCTIAKRLNIPQLQADANFLGGNPCSCSDNQILDIVEYTSTPDFNYEGNAWQPVIESTLFDNSAYADGIVLSIRPQSDNLSPYYNIDGDGMPISRGVLQYLRNINDNIMIYTQDQKGIESYYSGIVIDFSDAFSIISGSPHASYCRSPFDQSSANANSLNEPRRLMARINGAFIKVMNDIRREFPQIKVSVKGLGQFGDGNSIQTSSTDASTTDLALPRPSTRNNLQKRISESYGPLIEACDFIVSPSSSLTSNGIGGTLKLSQWIQDAVDGVDSIDMITMGDSNQCYDGTGWTDGLMHAMISAGANMYATPLFPSSLVSNSLIGYKCRFTSPGLGSRFIAGSSVSPPITELNNSYGAGSGNLQPAGPDPINPVKLTFAFLPVGGTAVGGITDIVNGWILDADNPLVAANSSLPLIFRQQYARKTGTNGSFRLAWHNVSGSSPSLPVISLSTAFSTSSTDTQYAWTNATFSLSPAVRTGPIGAFWRSASGPVAFGWSSVYCARKGAAVSCFDWHNSGGIGEIAADVTGLADATIVTYLKEIRDRQIAAGGSGRIAIFVNASFCQYGLCNVDVNNWRNKFIDIKNKIEGAWLGAGNSLDNIVFVSMVPHQHMDPDRITSNRNISYDISQRYSNVVSINLARIIPYSEITKHYYRDASGNVENLHLRASGYNAVSERIVSSLLAYGDNSATYSSFDSPISGIVSKNILSDIGSHFIDRNGTRTNFYASKERKPIWVASWLRTDTTSAPPFGYAAKNVENLGDINTYAYIKPMIDFNSSVGNNYISVTADAFKQEARMANIINAISKLPIGMRCLHLARYDASPVWGEIGDQLGTGGGLQSPWPENALLRMKNDWTNLAQHLASNNCSVDFIAMDNEQLGCNPDTPQSGWSCDYSSSMTFWGNRPDAHINAIFNSPKFSQSWYGTPSFSNIFTYGGRYTGHNSTNIKNQIYHPQSIRDYLYYDAALRAMFATLLREAIYKPSQSILGCSNISNFEDVVMRDWDTSYDQNGHPPWSCRVSGNACAPELYAGWNYASIHGISVSDNTRIIRQDYGSTLSFPSSAWNQMLILLQKMRAIKRAAPSMPIRPWIASKHFSDAAAGFSARWMDDAASEGLYNEKIRHCCLTGVDMFHLWNGNEYTNPSIMLANYTSIESIIKEVNELMGGWSVDCVTPERIDFTANYIISGASVASGGYLWRVTPKPGTALLDASNAAVVVDSDGGKWFMTATSEAPVFHV